MHELPDDITPEEAQKEYQAYLIRWWGSQVKAEFEARKNDPAVRRQHDPRKHQEAVTSRNQRAGTAAAAFWKEIDSGRVDPASEDFNQGNGPTAPPAIEVAPEAEAEAEAAPWDQAAMTESPPANDVAATSPTAVSSSPVTTKKTVVPEVSWQPARLASDLTLARKLAAKLDKEKDIAENPLLSDSSPGSKPQSNANGTAESSALGATDSQADDKDSGAVENGTAEDSKAESKGAGTDDKSNPENLADRLDILLTYLWRVHGCDYYSGNENLEPEDSQRSAPRPTLRCPRPEEGEQPDEELYIQQEAILNKGVDSVWQARLKKNDPFTKPLHLAATAAHLVAWTDSQVVKIDDKKWGSKVSKKLFVDREYVLKHIRNKHAKLVAEVKEKFQDELYYENFKAFKEKEQQLAKDAVAKARQAELAEQGLPFEEWAGGDDAGLNGNSGAYNGHMGSVPFSGVGGLMDVPAGCVLVPAPGAGPLGPFIPVPIDEAPSVMPMMGGPGRGMRPQGGPMNYYGGGGRGRRGPMAGPLAMTAGRGAGMAGAGMVGAGMGNGHLGSGGPMGANGSMLGGMGLVAASRREYLDLDDPGNNRKVLDYSDL